MENEPPVPIKPSHPGPWRPWGHHPAVVIVGVIAGVVIIATFLLELWDRQRRQPQPLESNISSAPPSTPRDLPKASEKAGESQSPAPLPSPVTLQEIAAYVYEEFHTSAQVDDYINRHLNRAVVWEGWVGNVSKHLDGTYSVILMPTKDSLSGLAFLAFPSSYESELLPLNYGRKIKVRGVLVKFDSRFHLEHCELLEVSPTSK